MPQKTNLNIGPYYDDFNKDKNFYKVLFRPGYPVQARELTTLQSSLHNQLESFGSHMFKEGSMVIPGNVSYNREYYSLRLLDDHLGIPVSLYISNLKGKRLKGQNSGVIVFVDDYKLTSDSDDITDITLFVNYVASGDNNTGGALEDGEQLITEESFVYGNTAVNAGDTVATLVALDSAATGSSAGIGDGVYFIRGSFVDVQTDKIVLDPYTNTPSYRVGLTISEEIIGAKDDNSLYDNARGFSNYAAPGADRLKISTTLSKKGLNDNDDKSFVEILRIDNGEVKKIQNESQYNLIKDYFAKRTYEESGNYSLGNFKIDTENSLNDGVDSGVFTASQQTDQNNTPSDDLMCVKVSPGKAYVKGYDVNKTITTVIDIEKPRDKKVIDKSLVPFELGTRLKVNNVFGVPQVAINASSTVTLWDQRANVGVTTTAGRGQQIGEARVYAFNPADAPYANAASTWDLYLFDVQTWTYLDLNISLGNGQLPVGSYIKGLQSGASGYATAAGGGNSGHRFTQTSGSFILGEQISINGATDISAAIKEIIVWGIKDIKSVYQNSSGIAGYSADFIADAELQRESLPGFNNTDVFQFSAPVNSTQLTTVTCPGKKFTGITAGSIVGYTQTGSSFSDTSLNRVVDINSSGDSMTITGIATVVGVCTGGLPTAATTTTLSLYSPTIKDSDTSGLYAPLPHQNVASVELGDSNLNITKQITGRTVNGSGVLTFDLSVASGISTGFFETYDAERYAVHYKTGLHEPLSSDQFTLANNSVTLKGLTASETDVVVSTTIKKDSIQNKQKEYVRSQKVTVNKVVGAGSTILSGLSTSPHYGMRIEDQEISLNVPDVSSIVAVYESLDTAAPSLDKLTFVSGLDLANSSILGERIRGFTSGAVAQLATRSSATEVEIIYLNSETFEIGESVTFEESNIVTNLQDVTKGSYVDVTNKFGLDKGQKEQYYDYSRLIRKENLSIPSRQILVVYNGYEVPSSDTGDVYTADSYGQERYSKDIPLVGGHKATDILDFRPRVAPFTSTTSSPFHYASRTFSGGVNPPLVVAPNESSLLGYSFYLPRIDKLILSPGKDNFGEFSLVKGVSSPNPKVPSASEDSMTIATINLPAYLYSPDDAVVTSVDNRRYTMRDIGKIEDRVENLEVVTSLSLLELSARTLQVQDANGIDKFKSGFFADDFKGISFLDVNNADCKSVVDTDSNELNTPLNLFTLKPELALDPSINSDTADFSANLTLLDSNVQKTGDLLTLKYTEKDWINQPLASRVENVNPFNIVVFNGWLTLNPESDNWVTNKEKPGIAQGTTVYGDAEGTVLNQVLVSSEPDPFIRSRNVAFEGTGLKPYTRYYPFFDSTAGIDVIPKLLSIIMTSGTFKKGETVKAYKNKQHVATFRLCQANHKYGDINNPSHTFTINPFDTKVNVPTTYSASSTLLNVDINSLSEEAQGKYSGYIPSGNDVVILGTESSAEAKVDNINLLADAFGDVYGAFFFRDPDKNGSLKFKNGSKTFRLTSSSTNAIPIAGTVSNSSADAIYTTSGVVDTYQKTTTFIKKLPPPKPPVIIYKTDLNQEGIQKVIDAIRQDYILNTKPAPHGDPLSQTFRVDETGAFLSAVDVFFKKKDLKEKIRFEIRTTEMGTPTETLIQPYSTVTYEPSQINVSDDASVPTKVVFPSPIYLPTGEVFAFVMLAETTNNYEAWIAKMGEVTVSTNTLPNTENVIIGKQYLGGSLFKSQNGTIWTPSQYEDLKFKLYKAQFNTEGDLTLYNPRLSNGSSLIPNLISNAVKTLPRKLKVGITTVTDMANYGKELYPGRKVSDSTNTNAVRGYIEKIGSRIDKTASGITLTAAGSGYPSGSSLLVDTYPITGNGSGAKVSINVSAAGTITSATIVGSAATGNGYCVGDLLGISTSSSTLGKGSEGTVTVNAIHGIDTLYVTNVQGRQFTNGQPLTYYNGNTAVSLASTTIRDASSVIDELYRGNVIEVHHFNHGMAADNNLVAFEDIEPDTPPVKLTGNITGLGTATISVANTAPFATHEGITTSIGYLKVNQEIIKYDGIGSGTLTIATGGRGVSGSLSQTHKIGDSAYKYELNGISLIGINTTHDMAIQQAIVNNAKDIDKYYIEVDRTGRPGLTDRGETGVPDNDDDLLCFFAEKSAGGDNIFASQNVQYNAVIPRVNHITPGSTTALTSQIRTVSATSASGNETSFIDQGYEAVELNKVNKLTSTRMVCSEINETEHLSSLPKNRSATLQLRMTSDDPNLSPVVDVSNAVLIYERNLLNQPINDYAVDPSSNKLTGDPHAAIYISRRINLKQPATSLKVLVGAYRHPSSDFRVLYRLFKPDSKEIDQSYELFPGYDNLQDTDGDGFGDSVINAKLNSGRADAIVAANVDNQFSEYQFTADNLDKFTGFAIKIVMSGTNEAFAPKLKDLQAIALA